MISDNEIIEAFRRSDNEGYRLLIDSYGNYAYTIVTEKVRGIASEEDKEECIADIFIETVKECKAYDFTMNSLKSVVMVVSKRKATDLFRKLYNRTKHSESLDECAVDPVDYVTPETESASKSEKEQLWDEVFKLGPPDSDIIIMQFFHGKTVREIAHILKMTTAAVNKRSQRAREKLRKLFVGMEAV